MSSVDIYYRFMQKLGHMTMLIFGCFLQRPYLIVHLISPLILCLVYYINKFHLWPIGINVGLLSVLPSNQTFANLLCSCLKVEFFLIISDLKLQQHVFENPNSVIGVHFKLRSP